MVIRRELRRSLSAYRAHPPVARTSGRLPRVSVVIPCYNYAEYVGPAIHSAQTQTRVDIEIVVTDNHSADGSWELIRTLAAEDDRIVATQPPEGSSPQANFNHGIDLATGEYIVRLDADDLLTPGCLHRAAAVFEAFPDVGLVYGRPMRFMTPEPPPLPDSPMDVWRIYTGRSWLEKQCFEGASSIISPEAIMRTTVHRLIGGYNPDIPSTDDFELWMRAAAVSDVGWIGGPYQAYKRDHPRSVRKAEVDSFLDDLLMHREAFEGFFARPLSEPYRDLEPVAQRALARRALERACWEYDTGRPLTSPVADTFRFAQQTYPDAGQLREWRALERRERAGLQSWPRHPGAWLGRGRRWLRNRIRDRAAGREEQSITREQWWNEEQQAASG